LYVANKQQNYNKIAVTKGATIVRISYGYSRI
jgi:hypothetical protein